MKIKNLYKSEKYWTKGAYARNPSGAMTSVDNRWATSFCLEGAVIKCYPDKKHEFIYKKILEEISGFSIVSFNDKNDFKTIKELVTKLDI